MRRLKITQKVALLGAAMLALMLVLAVTGFWSSSRLGDALEDNAVISGALRNQVEADMMHDALRADVLAALLAADGGEQGVRTEILADLADHAEMFRDRLRANEALPLPAEVRAALAEIGGPLADYIADAEAMVPLAFADARAAHARLPTFVEKFHALEAPMSTLSDRIEAASDRAKAAGGETRQVSQVVLLAAAVLGVVATLVVCLLISRTVVAPVTRITAAMERLATGDLATEIPDRGRRDEIGAMTAALQVFKDNAMDRARLETERRDQEEAKLARVKVLEGLTGGFDADISDILKSVVAAVSELDGTARAMLGTAAESTGQAASVSSASEQASGNVQAVAAAAEELSMSIGEIEQQVRLSQEVAQRASGEARRTDETVHGLVVAAQKIGEVVDMISSIAAQTNLLALNATIEAARAGDAGKGFAVVASEVKSLAMQTAKATDDIASQIQAMQGVSNEAATAIQGIAAIIGQMNDIAHTIGSAVMDQGGATKEIARNVEQAAGGTQDVTASVGLFAHAAGETEAAASRVLTASGALSGQSDALRGKVEAFLTAMRAA